MAKREPETITVSDSDSEESPKEVKQDEENKNGSQPMVEEPPFVNTEEDSSTQNVSEKAASTKEILSLSPKPQTTPEPKEEQSLPVIKDELQEQSVSEECISKVESESAPSDKPLADIKCESADAEVSEVEKCRLDAASALIDLSSEEMTNLKEEAVDDTYEGLNALVLGIDLLEEAEQQNWLMFDTLCEATRQECYDLGLGDSCHKLGTDILCRATYLEYIDILNWVDPMVLLKQEFSYVRQYPNQAVEIRTQNSIMERVADHKKEGDPLLQLQDNFECPPPKIKSLERMKQKIRNWEIMSQLEVELRNKLVDLRQRYEESNALKVRTSPKKALSASSRATPTKQKLCEAKEPSLASGSNGGERGPGRPKKRVLKSTKRKMGRPPKKIVQPPEEQEESDVGQPGDNTSLTPMGSLAASLSKPQHQNSLKVTPQSLEQQTQPQPPSPQKPCVTNLSTIRDRFMKGKANPFANLLKLASAPKEVPAGNAVGIDGGKDESSSSSSSDSEEDEGAATGSQSPPTSGSKKEMRSSLSSSTSTSSSTSSSDEEDSDKNTEDSSYSPKSHSSKKGSR